MWEMCETRIAYTLLVRQVQSEVPKKKKCIQVDLTEIKCKCIDWIIQWLGQVERMDETAMPKRLLKGKLCAKK
jgi:hypothetical protein